MKEYNVALKEGIDYDVFWEDMETETDGLLYIPNRRIEFTNERPASLRQCWYLLTDEEADTLRNDERVYCVEIPPEHRTDIIMVRNVIQKSDFTKTTSDSGNFVNWGLIRSNSATNVYGSGTTTTQDYTYSLSGKGVDVVIQDSGIQPDHPEFTDANGVSRVQQVNWASVSGLSFTQNANHYRDFDGHGTHVAGIAVGKTYGWAKNARIYAVKLSGLEGSGDSGTGISATYAFDCIKLWHTNKAGSRPTVVNMSWGYLDGYNSVTSLTYRGTTYSDANTTGNASYRSSNYGLYPSSGVSYGYSYLTNVRVSSTDVDVEEMISAGIVVCMAAGNRSHKIDVSAGLDYNNSVTTDQGTLFYHRGSSPSSPNGIIVGSLDSTTYSSTLDQKATYSETGPAVDIWAPGTNIMSATSTTNSWGAGSQNYYLNASYRQTNISGTSMASPQVCGIAALFFEMYPNATPAQIKAHLLNYAGSSVYSTGNTTDYSDTRSLLGSAQRTIYTQFTSSLALSVGGSIAITANFGLV